MDKPTGQQEQNGVIIVRLLGGLGNQMFQYALGRSLSIIHNRTLKLDLDFYKVQNPKWAKRTFDLLFFNIQAQIASPEELKPFKKYILPKFGNKILRRASVFIPGRFKSYIFEPLGKNFAFNSQLLTKKLPKAVYVDGFWQTEKYFIGIENVIRTDFQFREAPDEVNQKMLDEIVRENSVAVHIRHGDNASKIAARHGVLPINYYYKAVTELLKTVNNPRFYIFSDDLPWAKENLKLDSPLTFVAHNGEEKHCEDLRLMLSCKHHIIGNSTFSWWGAWLGKKDGQIVFAPSRYHMEAKIPMNDYYPKDWKLINVS